MHSIININFKDTTKLASVGYLFSVNFFSVKILLTKTLIRETLERYLRKKGYSKF